METIILCIFVIGYAAITLEHHFKIDKLIPALLMMTAMWGLIALGLDDILVWFDSTHHEVLTSFSELPLHTELEKHDHELSKSGVFHETLLHHFGKTCEILMFLVGAMTIVEIIEVFGGFHSIKITTRSRGKLLWIVCLLAFVLSAVIDNLTATIVLISILRKILPKKDDQIWYAGLIIIGANAGGAWSPIGDVTTTMLWMGEKVTTSALISQLIIPSFVCMFVPTLIAASFISVFKGKFDLVETESNKQKHGAIMLLLGLGMIGFVPVFKTVTHLPPYVGMMFSLGIVSLVAEFLSNREFDLTNYSEEKSHQSGPTSNALTKIEMPSILFFLGILMAVAAMESLAMVYNFGSYINESVNINIFVIILGAVSALIDNIPLVAAAIGMFNFPMDDPTWLFIAYAAGTGGSILIIGSAAGVIAMGLLKIEFGWYLKRIAPLAVVGYLAGAAVFLLL